MVKPPAKPGKVAPAESEVAAKPKSKRILLIVAGIILLGGIVGGGWYFAKISDHSKEGARELALATPKFIALEPFTVNLQHEEGGEGGDQFLQVGITLKILDPALEEKIKVSMPEIRGRLVMLLSSKHASELSPAEGKKKLAHEIISEINAVFGLRTVPARSPKPIKQENKAASDMEAASGTEAASSEEASAPAKTAPAAAHGGESSAGIVDVLFTSFIIQ